jgi:SNF2 family DNA or RNA helicase
LTRYADRIEDLLAAKNLTEDKKLPSYLLPQVVEIFKETGQPCPDPLKNLENLLSHVGAIPEAQLPADLKADLRPYQKIGVNWLCYLRDAKMGAMLADDMGLGKTLEALCAIRSGKRTLIVSPTSVIWAWTKQIEQFRPELGFSVYYGPQRKLDAKIEVVLTTYGLLRLDREALAKENWNTIIIDEAQVIKNPDSQVTRAVHSLSGDFKLALSGTPLENRLEDLWSQFQFINPGLLGDLDTFQERFSGPMTRGDERAAERLRTRVKPFILRRLKKEVAKDLPPRTEKVLYCELSSEEREIYNAILVSTRSEVLEKLESGGGVFAALEVLLRLRQACCHAGLIPGQKLERSSKLELLIQTLLTSIACGHRALVFSQWTSYLDLIEPELKSNGISYSRLDGATRNRDELVQEFQKSTGPSLMLISLKAGGVGLTLTAADHIFLMDPWWNPAVEDQAADRSHRIGQTNPVLIHRLVAQQTVEEKILELQKVKQALAASVLQNAAAAASITREDLLNLLR